MGTGPELARLKHLARNHKIQVPNPKQSSNFNIQFFETLKFKFLSFVCNLGFNIWNFPGKTIFLRTASNDQIQKLIQTSLGLLMPGLEDFGITALEAVNLGSQVIIHEQSGVAEIIKNNPLVTTIKNESVTAVKKAVQDLEVKPLSSAHLPPSTFHLPPNYDTNYFCNQFSSTIKKLYVNFTPII